jgi:sulfite reductase alpha subunit-like flavoprotein/predicted heme/steroid binding protein
VVAKTVQTEVRGDADSAVPDRRPWEVVHKMLSQSMIERLKPYHSSITVQPHEMRGCFEECRFKAKISHRSYIDQDPDRNTARVTIKVENLGLTFSAGDRLAIMPLNSRRDVLAVANSLNLLGILHEIIPNECLTAEWAQYAHHETVVTPPASNGMYRVCDILGKGHLSPLKKELVLSLHTLLQSSSPSVERVLTSDTWPVSGSLVDLLEVARNEVHPELWGIAFNTTDLTWLPKLIAVEVPRTYSISSSCPNTELMPSEIDLTVSRVTHTTSPLLGLGDRQRPGVSSGFLNPHPADEERIIEESGPEALEDEILVGISRPLNFQLPISPAAPVAMFAGGSGIAPFRCFLQTRLDSGIVGRNILFLGVPSRKRFIYEDELREYVKHNGLEVYTAFSRDANGLAYDSQQRDLVEARTEPRYIDSAIVEQSDLISDLVTPTKLGGLGSYIYICGSISIYESVISGIKRALYNSCSMTGKIADELLATAFAERRLMLDVFMTPRAISLNEPTIRLSDLARNTGHREYAPNVWIGIHGSVYDVTEFLPIHPGGSLIVTANAGTDASKTFDDLAHTTNPEVMSLLSKYFIGHLEPMPAFEAPQMRSMYNIWAEYLRTCVESLTTLGFETKFLQRGKPWLTGGQLSSENIRKFCHLQTRLIQDGFASLFGTR